MARKAFDKIMAGLEDALAYADGDISRGIANKGRTGLSEFFRQSPLYDVDRSQS